MRLITSGEMLYTQLSTAYVTHVTAENKARTNPIKQASKQGLALFHYSYIHPTLFCLCVSGFNNHAGSFKVPRMPIARCCCCCWWMALLMSMATNARGGSSGPAAVKAPAARQLRATLTVTFNMLVSAAGCMERTYLRLMVHVAVRRSMWTERWLTVMHNATNVLLTRATAFVTHSRSRSLQQ